MSSFIIILIFLFTWLLAYQIFLAYFNTTFNTTIIEGNTGNDDYEFTIDYNKETQHNAENINQVKSQLDAMGLEDLSDLVPDVSGNITDLQRELNKLLEAKNKLNNNLM
jgi:hypothetical protein